MNQNALHRTAPFAVLPLLAVTLGLLAGCGGAGSSPSVAGITRQTAPVTVPSPSPSASPSATPSPCPSPTQPPPPPAPGGPLRGAAVKVNAAAASFDLVPPPPPPPAAGVAGQPTPPPPPPPIHVTTGTTTVYLKPGKTPGTTVAATFADIKENAPAAVTGKPSADRKTVAADKVELLPPPPPHK